VEITSSSQCLKADLRLKHKAPADRNVNKALSCTTTSSSLPSSSPSYGKSSEVKGILLDHQGSRLKEILRRNGKTSQVILLYISSLTSVGMHFNQLFRIQSVN
jgi:hypothetical protein